MVVLPAPLAPEDDDDLALVDGAADVVENLDGAVTGVEPLDGQLDAAHADVPR